MTDGRERDGREADASHSVECRRHHAGLMSQIVPSTDLDLESGGRLRPGDEMLRVRSWRCPE